LCSILLLCASRIVLNVIVILMYLIYFCFFFQAEDGIRDRNVTGVQTCALPISIHDSSECTVTHYRLSHGVSLWHLKRKLLYLILLVTFLISSDLCEFTIQKFQPND